jgi:hypothetical protein
MWSKDDDQYDGEKLFGYADGQEKERHEPKRTQKLLSAQKLLDWLQNWTKPTVSARDICIYGPNSVRNREIAIDSAEILVKHGWLVPIKTHQRNMHEWQVVRRATLQPTVAAE